MKPEHPLGFHGLTSNQKHMPKFQYIGEGHTLVQTQKANREKVKVVQGEIIDIEEGIFSDGRLMMAGFQKIIDGIEDVVEAAGNVAEDIKDAITGEDSTPEAEDSTPEAEENEPETSEKEADDVTPAEEVENAQEAEDLEPLVEVTVEDDGKEEISIEAIEPEPKKAKKAKKAK
jgi:hypothetical protein